MSVIPTISLSRLTEPGTYGETIASSNINYPISFSYGFMNQKPTMPFVATTGTMTFFVDNLGSDFPGSSPVVDTNRGGLSWGYRLQCSYDTASANLFTGYADKWLPVPGPFEDRVTEVICHDYMFQLSKQSVSNLLPQASQDGGTLMAAVALGTGNPSSTDAMPTRPDNVSYDTSGEVYDYALHDIGDGYTKGITVVSKIAGSEMGHVYVDNESLIYKTRTSWIDGAEHLGTLDNTWSSIETESANEYAYNPIFVTYIPATTSDTDATLAAWIDPIELSPGASETLRLRYRDPSNESVDVTALSVTVGTTSTTDSDMPSSDYNVSYTNKGSAVEVVISNTSTLYPFTVETITATGEAIYLYNRATLVDSTVTGIGLKTLDISTYYQGDLERAKRTLDYIKTTYNNAHNVNFARSVTFNPCADSNLLAMAMNADLGDVFTLVEDANQINEDYRIHSIGWDIYAPGLINVTWGIEALRISTLFMMDSDDAYMTDSDGSRMVFWRL